MKITGNISSSMSISLKLSLKCLYKFSDVEKTQGVLVKSGVDKKISTRPGSHSNATKDNHYILFIFESSDNRQSV